MSYVKNLGIFALILKESFFFVFDIDLTKRQYAIAE
jgi:hypothetical protein